jgi:hypothetical protein
LIGAHASQQADALLSTDAGFFRQYFKKLKGLLRTYYNVIEDVEVRYDDPSLQPLMISQLKSCSGETNCGPSDFMSYVYESFIPQSFISPAEEANICPKLIPFPPYVFESSSSMVKRLTGSVSRKPTFSIKKSVRGPPGRGKKSKKNKKK